MNTLSKMENTKVLFFMALGETRSHLFNIPLPLHTYIECKILIYDYDEFGRQEPHLGLTVKNVGNP